MAPTRNFIWETSEGDDLFAIPLPFDPREAFGKARAPVVVTINGYSYRSTVAMMGGPTFIPFRKSHRDASGVGGPGAVEVTLTLDEAPRTVDVPDDLAAALDALPGGREAWDKLSYTHQREHVEAIEGAKKPETRNSRIGKAVAMVTARLSS